MDIAKLFLKLNFNEEQKEGFLAEYEKSFVKKDEYFKDRLGAYEQVALINSILWRLHILREAPDQTSSVNEQEFYDRVKKNFDRELINLQNFLKNKNQE
jgi:hypothetical protein